MFANIDKEKIEREIQFSGKNNIFKNDNTIPELQLKGVMSLCKILQNNSFAYLADEVGMGKTYQAIGVLHMLLCENKNAKILIIAPNENVQNNWLNEINNFIKNNANTKLLKSNDIKLIDPIEIVKNNNERKNAKIDIVRLTTFSIIANKVASQGKDYIRNGKEISATALFNGIKVITKRKYRKYYNVRYSYFDAGIIAGSAFREFSPKYDLVIIDEAQNIRNKNNATMFLNQWLGLKRFKADTNIANLSMFKKNNLGNVNKTKFLLISATPAHRGRESLRNQLSYFVDKNNMPELNHEYLEKFLIRRLRTYNGQNKYSVRTIQAADISKTLSIEQKLFLAMIQSKLAHFRYKNNSSFKIGFLETFESYDPSNNTQNNDEETDEKDKEFENGGSAELDEKGAAMDKKMISDISKSFKNNFKSKKYPPHPKLDYVSKDLEPIINNNLSSTCPKDLNKAIIFVRRIASVNELSRRLNNIYQQSIISYWGDRFGIKDAKLKDIQEKFQTRYKGNIQEKWDEESQRENEIEDSDNIKSELISWMTIKKNDKSIKYNCVSLFKKSIMSNKTNSYIFDENYYMTAHKDDEDIENKICNIVDDDFLNKIKKYVYANKKHYIIGKGKNQKFNESNLMVLCCYIALSKERDPLSKCIEKFYGIDKIYSETHVAIDSNDKELTKTKIKKTLMKKSIWNYIIENNKNKEVLCSWVNKKDFSRREAVKLWIEKYIKTSEAILELLYVYCYAKGKSNNNLLCKDYYDALFNKNSIHGIRINKLFNEEMANLVCNQLLGSAEINTDYNTSFMNNQQWVMPAIGGNNGNKSLIKRFNTPFYPDIIVCTDIMKEGINLHLFCDKVYHYGLAWTPGDLEQRVGRVDRFFSKTHRAILKNEEAHIDVIYPYMGKTVDEQQLRKVLKFKISSDPLLDSVMENDKEIDLDIIDNETIEELIKHGPNEETQTNFPYSGDKFWKDKQKK